MQPTGFAGVSKHHGGQFEDQLRPVRQKGTCKTFEDSVGFFVTVQSDQQRLAVERSSLGWQENYGAWTESSR